VRFSAVQTGPGAHPASCTMGTGSFLEVKYGKGMLLTTHPLLVAWSWKGRAIPLPTLWTTTGSETGTLYLFFLIAYIKIFFICHHSTYMQNHPSAHPMSCQVNELSLGNNVPHISKFGL